jgi:hypothetical protein
VNLNDNDWDRHVSYVSDENDDDNGNDDYKVGDMKR